VSDVPPARVLCKRRNGFSFMHDGKIVRLEPGINEAVDRVAISRWFVTHRDREMVRDGTIRILEGAR
jgi:hypothetical protein